MDIVETEGTAAAANGGSAHDGPLAAASGESPTPTAAQLKQAEELKQKGNQCFAESKFDAAIEYYTQAITLAPNAILYSNRAFAHIKLENYGSAMSDATEALKYDPTFVKAYYRRGTAHLALGQYKEGLQDFREAVKIKPRDKDVRLKYKKCEKAYKEDRLQKAIAFDDATPSVIESLGDVDAMVVEEEYDGPHLPDPITLDFVIQMMEHFRKQKVLHKKYVYKMLIAVKKILSEEETLVRVQFDCGKFTIFGDIHGQYYDLLNVFENLNGYPSESNPCLFNGDFVDRGSFSVEVILTLFAFKMLYPKHVFLNRGNHEAITMNKVYGFEGEVRAKYNPATYQLFCEVFCQLPLAHVINQKVLVVHGGLFSEDGVTLENIRKTDRFREPPDAGIMCEALWADPQPLPGRAPSKRGVGLSFGPDVTKRFLEANRLDLLVRSHECRDMGYQLDHDGKCITVFSAPNYCDQIGNKGAIVVLDDELKPSFVTYSAVPHPKVPPMAYASNFSMFGI
ncbi:Serine/threonine-protein phosphatase 5 [Balamuthia mandrillaris]